MTADDLRPAPRYGEYATPEEVAALRGIPVEAHATAAIVPVVSARPLSPPASSAPASSAAGPALPRTGARRYDPIVTIALLVFGLINVIQTAPYYLEFDNALEAATADTSIARIDFGDAARAAGYWLLAIDVLLLVAAVVVAFARLRRGRVAFWVPLTAAALSLIATVVTMLVVLLETPGALSAVG